jgi:hypothetical protein
MNYLFAGGYKGFLFALYLRNVLGKEITIVTYDKTVIKNCIDENITYIEFEKIRPTITSFYKVFTLKKVLDEVIKKVDIGNDDTFFLLGIDRSYDNFYLVKELSKKSNGCYKLVNIKLSRYVHPRFKPIFFRGAFIRILFKLILDLDLIYYDTNRNPRYGISEEFLEKYNIVEYEPDVPSEEIIFDAIKGSKSSYKEFDNLIVCEGAIESAIKFDSTKKLYKNLFELPIKFSFKKHPTSMVQETQPDSMYHRFFKNCEEIPIQKPVELFFNNVRKNVISMYSASLITASKFKHLNAISLIELVDWYDASLKFKREIRDYLIKESDNKIFFPKDFDELKEILLSS